MRLRLVLLALTAALLGSVLPVAVAGGDDVACVDLVPEQLGFADRVVIDPDRAGGEPVAVVGHDGSLNVSAHAGTTHLYKNPDALGGVDDFAVGYTNQVLNWRSVDGGRTWDYIGLAGLNAGPHSATSTGFSDPDYAIDQAGNIYNTEIDLANVSVFASLDDGQSYALANPEATSGDRPWLAALEDGEVFLYVNTARQLWRSADHGVTWLPIGVNVPINAKPYPDPVNPDDGLIGPVGRSAIAITADDGESWTVHAGPALRSGTQFFDTGLAVDAAGNAYLATAGQDTDGGYVDFSYFDRDAEAWGEVSQIPLPFDGRAMWSWVTAGDEGRVNVSWMMSPADDPRSFHLVSATTLNATGTTVTCPDGSTAFVPPQWSVAVATPDPIHVGAVCLSGTTCNLNTGEGGDRRLGDFFTTEVDPEGRVFLVSADTTLESAFGGPKPVGNPIFVLQDEGPLLYETPREVRDTRCLTPTAGTPLCQR